MTAPAIRVSDVTKVFATPFRRRRIIALQHLNLEIAPGEIYGLLGSETKSRIVELLATVGLARAADARLSTYSKGMLQRIGLAQALIHQPKILVLDEPTAAVDPAGSRDIQNLILSLKKRGTTI